ncbi:hypothetical protein [Legionella longbeachae]|uniref:Uncharacterized protein n=1 Tax=Legionella longbeachae serogroup 1 (strain NSW150) TaxID=661367 RepID=D3HSW3_LEGLN|nr:hypothetical protein [Legionella longbeachae]VEE02494.1 Uncharacterised protein [Legionella oakridgensis]ARB91233.1 hypothetical protein A6J40_03085 [Legionella longbeachae]EEZ93439.1 hypothetical protein LLB_3834 [Legionella longbeachae D-4968]QIN32344.1 hypothetical protein GCB94_09385 [Legionella longbeachae]QIN35690.1 hypothetical protein GCS73_08625 [Legionella longbeachae]
MDLNIFGEIKNFFLAHFNNKWITTVGILISAGLGVFNLWHLKKAEQIRTDEMLFQKVIPQMKEIIKQLTELSFNKNNDASTWSILIEQLAAFHNIAIKISNFEFRQLYCVELNAFSLGLYNLMKNIDDYRFFYGIENYQKYDGKILHNESRKCLCNISPNVIGCILQFLFIFNGVRGDYLSNKKEIDKSLVSIHYGWTEDLPPQSDVESMASPYKQMYTYVNEWSSYKNKESEMNI